MLYFFNMQCGKNGVMVNILIKLCLIGDVFLQVGFCCCYYWFCFWFWIEKNGGFYVVWDDFCVVNCQMVSYWVDVFIVQGFFYYIQQVFFCCFVVFMVQDCKYYFCRCWIGCIGICYLIVGVLCMKFISGSWFSNRKFFKGCRYMQV